MGHPTVYTSSYLQPHCCLVATMVAVEMSSMQINACMDSVCLPLYVRWEWLCCQEAYHLPASGLTLLRQQSDCQPLHAGWHIYR